jgi:hypothetical protein
MKRLWVTPIILLALGSLVLVIQDFGAHAQDEEAGPFEVTTQNVNGILTLVRVNDGTNACYLVIKKIMSTGTAPPRAGLAGFECLPLASSAE